MNGSPSNRPHWLVAGIWTLVLGALFFLVYGTTNYLASQRESVGAMYFAWERYIPFVAIMVIPYMSIDFFYAGSTFLCRDRDELHTLAKRIVFAIAVSGACFLWFPLRLAWGSEWPARPETTGFVGVLFGLLSMDQPHNLAPSLHISLRSILWGIYGEVATGLVRGALAVWFLLIGMSTLLVWQHHVIDIFGGTIVTVLAFYMFPHPRRLADFRASRGSPDVERSADRKPAVPPRRNRRVGAYYGAGAIACILFAVLLWPWGALLLWPATALGMLTLGYAKLGPRIFYKNQGRLHWSTRVLLFPYLAGAWISWRQMRRGRLFDSVAPGVLLGARLQSPEIPSALAEGVSAVLDLTSEFDEPRAFRELDYFNLQVIDLTTPTVEQMQLGVEFIRRHAADGTVYVHCALGRSRSAAVAAAYLLATGQAADPQAALEQIRAARPQVVIRPDLVELLTAFADRIR